MVQLVIIRKLRYLPVLAHVHHVHFSKETTALISFPLSVGVSVCGFYFSGNSGIR